MTEDIEEVALGFGYGIVSDRNYNIESATEYDYTTGLTSSVQVSAVEKYNQGLSMGVILPT
ncbi:hypothetical protein [Emticicia sp. BO119]|uniref:hypothetical protein n=1 Tax=Emticicia sp. BO119 TaxID=2757768 RepID=UPI0015F0DA2F|nr:hypothetical protein [Emticicia sp. BO119]MBA4850488.1 hypothetical protein [Emticicia sp. BO119]